jgi:hypothetical protein
MTLLVIHVSYFKLKLKSIGDEACLFQTTVNVKCTRQMFTYTDCIAGFIQTHFTFNQLNISESVRMFCITSSFFKFVNS